MAVTRSSKHHDGARIGGPEMLPRRRTLRKAQTRRDHFDPETPHIGGNPVLGQSSLGELKYAKHIRLDIGPLFGENLSLYTPVSIAFFSPAVNFISRNR